MFKKLIIFYDELPMGSKVLVVLGFLSFCNIVWRLASTTNIYVGLVVAACMLICSTFFKKLNAHRLNMLSLVSMALSGLFTYFS